MTPKSKLLLSALPALLFLAAPVNAATILGWNKDNVDVGSDPATVGDTGVSVVYDRDATDPDAVTNGRIAFTPPEAVSPGIYVVPETYTQGGSDPLTLDGCIMTSNPTATCTSPFQSGKRVKTQVTDTGPIDLVFDLAQGAESNYQVFYRLINQTMQSLDGFSLELGFGVGDSFQQASATDGVTFSTAFQAQPASAGASSTTQFPFGLFGDAISNPNFSLDGFFAPERAGLNVLQTETTLTSTGFFGPYDGLFGSWLSQESVPMGAFWDNDNDASTDALLMAWYTDGSWEMRRDVLDLVAGTAKSLTGVDVEYFTDFSALVARLGLGDALFEDAIEDLANLNVNFAINLSDSIQYQSFTLRTTTYPTVTTIPLPFSAPLLAGGVGFLTLVTRRRRKTT